ncbi:hypothetical protein [Apilactobacillus micheneri]|uniref:hypothetical protein n=1 Tax=Apilactobacillus micheneri TaxID=1899430 RepID=UPI000D5122F4|nr:hypothetical protein [Apilactobacillus micheneri]GAY79309.1 hypothetical protein NBRC113063_00143 [Apilactobacillus micheneri]
MNFEIKCALGILSPLTAMIFIYNGLNSPSNMISSISLLILGTIFSGSAMADIILKRTR